MGEIKIERDEREKSKKEGRIDREKPHTEIDISIENKSKEMKRGTTD